jgi:hypothetical protein
LSVWSSRLSVPIFGHMWHVGSEREAKMWFLGQILSKFDLYVWGQVFWNFKNAVTYLFIGLSRLLMPIFGQIGHAESEREAKTWFLGQILSKFDLWPLPVRSILRNLTKRIYRLVCRVKSLVRDHFYPHRTYWIRTISQNVISERNFVKFWPLTSPREVNYAKFQKRRYGFVFRAKLLGCANFWPNQRDGFRVIPKPNWIL